MFQTEVGMRIKIPVALFVVLGSVLIVSSAQAQNSYLYVAHAASGRGMSTPTNPALPVDLSVQGICVATGITYGEIRGLYSVPAGAILIQLTMADYSNPCGGPSVFIAAVTLGAGGTYYGILTLDGSGNPAGQIYTADLSPVPVGTSRVAIINASQDSVSATFSAAPGAYFPLPAGTLQPFNPLSGLYTITLVDSNQNLLVGPVNLDIAQGNTYVYVVAGSAATNVQWIGPAVVHGVF
jgi:hypothetical protein